MALQIELKNAKGSHFIPLDDLLFIVPSTQKNKCYFCTKKEEFDYLITLDKAMTLIEKQGTFEVHHCAKVDRFNIINFNNVSKIERDHVYFASEKREVHTILAGTCIKAFKEKMHELGKDSLITYGPAVRCLSEKMPKGTSVWAPEDMDLVDLGLPSGLLWGSYNLGAKDPESYGIHISWGELYPKKSYDKDDSDFYWGQTDGFRYEEDADEYDWNKSDQLPDVFDIAHRTYDWFEHSDWHIPTKEEWNELCKCCNFIWCNNSNDTARGVLVTGPNGNHIFLPAAGFSQGDSYNLNKNHELAYWSSTYGDVDEDDRDMAFSMRCQDSIQNISESKPEMKLSRSYLGLSIRPVFGGCLPSTQSRQTIYVDNLRYRKIDEETCEVDGFEPTPDCSWNAYIKEKVVFPDKVRTVIGIREEAFGDFSLHELYTLSIPSSIEHLDVKKIRGIESIVVAPDHKYYNSEDGVLFDKDKKVLLRYPDCGSDTKYKVPEGVEQIGESAFQDCLLEEIDTTDVITIGSSSFKSSDYLIKINAPKVTRVKDHAFALMDNLQELRLPSVIEIEPMAFEDCDLKEFIIPTSLKKLDASIFADSGLEDVKMLILPEKISPDPFGECTEIRSVTYAGKRYSYKDFCQELHKYI